MSLTPRPRWKSYLLLGRVSNLPTVWTNGLAAAFLAAPQPDSGVVVVGAMALSAFYIGGMFLNDAFDRGYDRTYRSERPIPSGDVSTREVFAVGFGLLVLGETLLALPGMMAGQSPDGEALAWGGALAGLIVYYDYRHKNNPLSPVLMALCRVMVYTTGAALADTAFDADVAVGAMLLALYLIGLTYVAKQENLDALSNAWPLAFIALPFAARARLLSQPGGAVLWVAFLAWVVYAVSFLYRKSGRTIPRAVIQLIAGISLLDALALVAIAAPLWTVAAAAAGFGLTLALQRYVPGT